MAAFNISPQELLTVRDRLLKQQNSESNFSSPRLQSPASDVVEDDDEETSFDASSSASPLFLKHLSALTENEDRNQTGDDSSRKSLEHFRAKLKQLRPLSLGSIVGSKGSSSSDVPSPLSGLSLTAAASSASTNASSTSNSVKRASGSWNQPGHPNPSALNVSAQLAEMMEEEGEVENQSFNNYQQMATVVNDKFPNHSVTKFAGRQKTCKWCTRLRSTTRSGRRPETTYGCAICGLNLHRDYCFLAYHYHLVVPLPDTTSLQPPPQS